MNYQERSGFEPYDMSWNDDESTPRTDLGDLLNPTGEAYEMRTESQSPAPIDTPDEPGDTEDEHDVPHPSQESDLKKDIHHNFSQVSNLASMLEGVESTTESVSQHKYSRLAQSSYDYFNSKGNADLVNTNLKNPKYSHIDDLNGFELDKELSTLDDAVLHNKLTGETVISFRGTTSNIKETKAFLKDWEVNSKIMFNPKSAENTRRMKNAFSNTEMVSKYGKDNVKVVDIHKVAMSHPPSRKRWIWRDTIIIPPFPSAKSTKIRKQFTPAVEEELGKGMSRSSGKCRRSGVQRRFGLDAAKNAEEYVVDNAIMDVGIAAAPETFGLSLLVAGAATVLHNLAVDSIVNVAKSTLTTSVASLTTAVNSEALIQNTNRDVIIPQRALSPTLWGISWTIGATDFTNVNGLKRKPTSDLAATYVELTLPYAVVATGIEAMRRTDGATGTSSVYQSWNVQALDATNNSWVDLNMDNSMFETTGNPAYYPTQFREITGNTVSSNTYRVFRGADAIGKYFDGFRIYSKDESPPAIPLGDVIESLIELNTFH
ncbi:unnamed protein product [Bathycoccus prasinos]